MKLGSDEYKREYADAEVASHHRAFTRSPLALPATLYQNLVIPAIDIPSELDSEDESTRLNVEGRVINDIKYAAHLKPQGPIYVKPSTSLNPESLGKFLLQQLVNTCYEPIFVIQIDLINNDYYRRMHYHDSEFDKEEVASSWTYWNKIHAACGYSYRFEVALVLSSDTPDVEDEVTRWLGETVHMLILPQDCFMSNSSNLPVLSKQNQDTVRLFMQASRPAIVIEPEDIEDRKASHFGDYLRFQEKFVETDEHACEQDHPRYPLQPLRDNLDFGTYETFESDIAKYLLYQRAIEAALIDMVPEKEKKTRNTVVMIVGAGQGPLVRAALNASENTGRKLKVVVVEKNPNAMNVLEAMKRDLWIDKDVELIFGDMRKTEFEGNVDILVSELLGSFGDNELSPECLDGVQQYLKPTGISIPCNSVSYLRPVMSKRVNTNIVRYYDKKLESKTNRSSLEGSWLVYFGSIYYIDDCKEVFTFEHPNRKVPIDNSRHGTFEFTSQTDCVLSGFAGYFTSKLYKNIEISIHPETHTRMMKSWYSIYFPFTELVTLAKGDTIGLEFWRKCDEKKVWYEYKLTSPKESEVMNQDGAVHPIHLQGP